MQALGLPKMMTEPTIVLKSISIPLGNYHNFSQNTNWVKEITQIGHVLEQNFSVRGGGDKSKYKMSLGYQDEQGTTIGTGLKKISISTSLDYDLSSKIRLKTDVMFTRYDRDANYEVAAFTSIRSKAYVKMPNMSVYEMDKDGNQLESFSLRLKHYGSD